MSNQAIKRIVNRDIKEIENLHEMGIHVNFNEENMLEAFAMIIGPKDTPYENGILYFKIDFPTNYPYSPPKVYYYSTSRYRIHPNLYVGKSHNDYLGKVCLSIINTWAGPKWTSIMHIGSVLMSIQSLLDKNPLHNEPGFENELGERNDIYNQIVEYDKFVNLICKNCFNIPENFKIFENQIKSHLIENFKEILDKINILKKTKNKKLTLNIYNLSVITRYDYIEELLLKHKKILNLI